MKDINNFITTLNAEVIGLIFFIILVSIFLYLYVKQLTKKKEDGTIKKLTNEKTKYEVNDKVVSKEEFSSYDPFFKEDLFQYITFETFKKLQYSWSSFDYDQIKKIVVLKTYLEYVAKLDDFKKKGYQHIIRDLDLIDSKINYVSIENNIETTEVYFSTTCYNYLIANFSSRIVQGSSTSKYLIDYKVTLTRDLNNDKKTVTRTHCSTCGKNITAVKTAICPYCSSMIIPENYDFKIVKKEIVKEKYMN